ncbi:LOW QUALITY PROTEIN: TELO2-interacting protein 2 [Hippoglossus hippoglossus]|uniref:LOW QUALITY PROTEIN: TELO2-interacting protein 2 n=1 Tax=Hippoglossus hippoglossus TaxID=8267 RepID=UPI00148B8638|nr:LOW QUALITY PROTEIN: TELO2-interacting protein 2 [Hippoglossus hippoglossus]
MELSSLLHDLHLLSSEKPLPPPSSPSITALLARLQEKLIGASSDSDTSSLIGHVERLFQTADPDWLFSLTSVNEEGRQEELQSAYRALISALIGCADLPLCEDDCGSLAPAAYQSIPSRAVPVCSVLRALLGALGNWEGSGLLLSVAPPVCVFAVTHFQDQVWTNPPSRAAAQSLQEALLRAGGWRDSTHLLVGDGRQREGGEEGGILRGVLDVLQPQLTKDSWQRCVAVKLVFSWTLLQVTPPSLSPHLPRLLPPPLLFNDHYRPENCMLGVRCLHHIILNTPAADLRQFNRADVIYQALFKHLYTTEKTVIQLVLSCLLDLLLVLEKPPSSLDPSSSRRKPCRHDDMLRLVLIHMEAENNVALRRVYASVLPLLVDRMGVAVCRHLRRVERVVLGYLEVRDPPEETNRLKVLEVLQRVTRAAWPRMQRRRLHLLLRSLLQLMVDVSSDSQLHDSVREKLMSEATLCIKLLHDCSPGNAQTVLQQVDSSCCSPEVLGCLVTVTTR